MQSSTRTPRRGSLAYRLPLLIIALLLLLVAGGAAMAYREVRATAVAAWEERLGRVSTQLAALLESSAANRLAALRQVASAPEVQEYLAGGGAEEGAARALREHLAQFDDSLPVELWHGPGRVALRAGVLPEGLARSQMDSLYAAVGVRAQGGYSELMHVADRTWVWMVAPVVRGDRMLGRVAQLRPIGGDATNQSERITALIGTVSIYFVNESGSWYRLDGTPVAAPPASAETDSYERDGVRAMMRRAPVANSPLSVVAEAPIGRVLAQPTRFLRQLLLGSTVLMLLGALGAWLLSRSIVAPLKELSRAARDIAAGDYTRRVRTDRTDELGTLAGAFNTMAAEVERSRDALREQLNEARRLTDTLEATNRQLTEAMDAADHARADAEAANQAKTRFLATMSHEIRTPINAIIGYTDLLRLEIPGSLTPEQRAQMERIRTSGQHLIRLVDEVLDLSRIESGRLQVQQRIGSMEDAIVGATSVVAPDARAKGITLATPEPRATAVWYCGDPHRVGQVLINLMMNAVKFTPEGGRIDVSAWEEASWACVAVKDTGVGMEPEKVEALFEAFVQGDSGYTREHGGVGLGLAISRQLARLMGGDIAVTTTPGTGSTFVLRLPLVNESDAATGRPGRSARETVS